MIFRILIIMFIYNQNILNAYEFGKDIKVEGMWNIKPAKKNSTISFLQGVGNNFTIRIKHDKKVYKLDNKTLEGNINAYNWELINDGILHLEHKSDNQNFITNLILKNVNNHYLKIYKKVSENCYLTTLQNGNQEIDKNGVIMCKLKM